MRIKALIWDKKNKMFYEYINDPLSGFMPLGTSKERQARYKIKHILIDFEDKVDFTMNINKKEGKNGEKEGRV